MMTQEQNDLLTQTGPGTPCGRLLRSYWQPIAASEEMPPGGDPLPVRIMSEDLVLFRDDKDRLGLIGPDNATGFAAAGLAVVTAVALTMLARTCSLFYAAAVVWAFVGIWAAERADSGLIAGLALACAAITALGWAAFSRRT